MTDVPPPEATEPLCLALPDGGGLLLAVTPGSLWTSVSWRRPSGEVVPLGAESLDVLVARLMAGLYGMDRPAAGADESGQNFLNLSEHHACFYRRQGGGVWEVFGAEGEAIARFVLPHQTRRAWMGRLGGLAADHLGAEP